MRIEVPPAFYNEGSNYTGRIAQDLHLDGDLDFQGPQSITTTSGDLTVDIAADIVLDAGGGDIFFKDDGTTFGSATNTSGNLIIKSGTTTAMTFSGANLTAAGTIGSGAITSTGILKTDDTTEASSTTDGSLQTDGGLSVAKDAIIGDDLKLLSDSAVLAMGVDSDFTITHDGTTGATLAGNPITITSANAATWSTSSGDLTLIAGSSIVIQHDDDDTISLNNATSGTKTDVRWSEAGTWKYALQYDAANDRFALRSTNVGSGADGDIFRVGDGGNTLEFIGGWSANADCDLGGNGLYNAGASGNNWTGTLLAMQDTALLKIGATSAHGTTAGTNLISLFNGTAPAGTLTNGASIYCSGGVMKVINADGSGGTIDFS